MRYRATFDTAQFYLHGQDETGRFSAESHEIEGPNNLGFVLDVWRRERTNNGAAN